MARPTDPIPSAATLGRAFRTEWIDPKHGIRVGNLEPHERITQVVKAYVQDYYGQPFVIDKWGRGSYWRWICWVPRLNREAKPVSGAANWCSAKFYMSLFPGAVRFTCGLQVERGFVAGPSHIPGCLLRDDWDWHRLMGQLRKNSPLDAEMRRLIGQDGFEAWIGDRTYTAANYTSAGQLKRAVRRVADDQWAGFQLYYPFPCPDVAAMPGPEFIEAVCSVFVELTDAFNCVVDVPVTPAHNHKDETPT